MVLSKAYDYLPRDFFIPKLIVCGFNKEVCVEIANGIVISV